MVSAQERGSLSCDYVTIVINRGPFQGNAN